MSKKYFEDLEQYSGTISFDTFLSELNFNSDGLIAAIAQQHDTGQVLMQAWMNRDSLKHTLTDGYVTYWSRSRGKLWRKGEQSGHLQRLVDIRCDCDGDSLLCLVDQTGAACHTLKSSCFFFSLDMKNKQISVLD